MRNTGRTYCTWYTLITREVIKMGLKLSKKVILLGLCSALILLLCLPSVANAGNCIKTFYIEDDHLLAGAKRGGDKDE